LGELPLVPPRRRDHGAGDALRLAERTESISRIGLSAGVAVGYTGSLTGDVTINKLTRVITPATASSQITSTLDGSTEVLLDPARLAASRAAV
jgi:hypothetical protein